MPVLETTLAGLLLWALIGYLLGSVPFGLVIARLLGLGDLRKIGSGNIGATNVLRTGNRPAALATLILDSFKGAIAVLIARWLAAEDAAQLALRQAFRGTRVIAAFLDLDEDDNAIAFDDKVDLTARAPPAVAAGSGRQVARLHDVPHRYRPDDDARESGRDHRVHRLPRR